MKAWAMMIWEMPSSEFATNLLVWGLLALAVYEILIEINVNRIKRLGEKL